MYPITGPSKLTVEIKGKAKNVLPSGAGIYTLGPNAVYGRSIWLQDSGPNAIWYDKKIGVWNIGHRYDVGSKKSNIRSHGDVAGPQEAKRWVYYNKPKWIKSDDILVNSFKLGTYKELDISTFGLGSRTEDVCP